MWKATTIQQMACSRFPGCSLSLFAYNLISAKVDRILGTAK